MRCGANVRILLIVTVRTIQPTFVFEYEALRTIYALVKSSENGAPASRSL